MASGDEKAVTAGRVFLRRARVLGRRGMVGALILMVVAGCGYRLGYVKPSKYATVQSLYIPTFKNETLEPRAAVLVTDAVIQQFQRDGTYQVATEGRADAVLEASIARLERRQARSARFDTLRTRELEFTLVVNYRFRDLRTQQILDQGTVEGETGRFLDPNFQLTERQALPLAAERMANHLVSRLSEGW